MSGLVAIFNPDGMRTSLSDVVRRMPSRAVGRDEWGDRCFRAVRLHHGVFNPEAQPVRDPSETLFLFMDGEFHGRPPLAAGAPSQAAACLAAFRNDPSALAGFNGSFAAIVYDSQRRTVSLISDRMNTRPLYYFQAGRELVVASHIAALTGHPRCPRELNRQSLHELIAYRQVLGGNTIYQGIRWMEPGSIVTFDGRSWSTKVYWKLAWREPSFSRQDLPELLADGFRQAVRRRMGEGRRHGLLLSGGLDSRVILAAAETPMVCCTLGDVETDQVRCARKAASLRGLRHDFLPVSPEDFWENFGEGVRLTGGMYGYQQNHFLPVLDQLRNRCDVVFTGSYMDTILRATFMPARKLRLGGVCTGLPWLEDVPTGDLAEALVRSQKPGFPPSLVNGVLSGEARTEHEARLTEGMRGAIAGFESPYLHHAWSYLMMRSIPHNFAFPNVLSIRSRMDVQIVAWDHGLLDIALQMPPHWGLPDTAYRKALSLLSPELGRLEYANEGLPAETNPYLRTAYGLLRGSMRSIGTRVLHRRPLAGPASWLDFDTLLRRPGPLRDRLVGLSQSEAIAACGIFSPAGIKDAVTQHLHRQRNIGKFLLMLLTIDEWIRQFGADTLSAPSGKRKAAATATGSLEAPAA